MSVVRACIPDELAAILRGTPELARTYLVGGCVRDALLGRPIKDFDVEVFGVEFETLVQALSRWGRTDVVGRSFGVVKLNLKSGVAYDFSLPRRDSKVGPGHKGFAVAFDPDISPEEAAARRDFTINALMYDYRGNGLLDAYQGQADLQAGVLRHVSPAFVEDPLRVLRGMQFAGRFSLKAAPETLALCRSIRDRYHELAVERVREEWFKWAEKSVEPSAGLRFLADSGWITHFPEVAALSGTPQDPEWHPEGDVFIHTGHCLDALVRLPQWQLADTESRIVYALAILAHDFGKPATTHEAERQGRRRIVSPGHEEAGGPLAEQFLERIGAPGAIRARVPPLVTNHLAHLQTLTDRSVRRLARRLVPENIEGLCTIIRADLFGRPPRPAVPSEALLALERMAAELRLEKQAPKPLLLGRHLLELGLEPGPDFGRTLHDAFEAQLEGEIRTVAEAWSWLARRDDVWIGPASRQRLADKMAALSRP